MAPTEKEKDSKLTTTQELVRSSGTPQYKLEVVEDELKNDFKESMKPTEFERREYQIELIEIALKENVIICLPTGSGKTFIALQVIQRTIGNNYRSPKKVFFLANTKQLVYQQARFLKDYLADGIAVLAITGDSNADFWTDEVWEHVLQQADVFVMTTQILTNAEESAFVSWENISLLVLDECHHSTGKNPLKQLMISYKTYKLRGADVPKVLGLTATVVNGATSVQKLDKSIEDIQQTLCSRAITYHNWREVLSKSTKADPHWVTYPMTYSRDDFVCVELQMTKTMLRWFDLEPSNKSQAAMGCTGFRHHSQIYERKCDVATDMKRLIDDVLQIYEDLGPYCAVIAAEMKRGCINNLLKDLESGTKQMLVQCVDTKLAVFIVGLKKLMKSAFHEQLKTGYNHAEEFQVRTQISGKIRKLVEIFLPYGETSNGSRTSLCAILFCERRTAAHVIHKYLNDLANFSTEFAFIKADVVVGTGTKGKNVEDALEFTRSNLETIARFKWEEFNVLVATKVLEEGIDIPSCNLVLRFDGVETYPSFVQSMGRARKEGAKYYVFIPGDSTSMEKIKKLEMFKSCSVKLAQDLSQKIDTVGDDLELVVDPSPEIPDFCPFGPDGPRITQVSASSVVHTYCQRLYYDDLNRIAPIAWCTYTSDGKVTAYLLLPRKASIKGEIEGPPMSNKILAKRAVYLKACQLLYENNEFNNHLLPIDPTVVKFECALLKRLELTRLEDEMNFPGKAGCYKRAQWYQKMLPLEIKGEPIEEQRCTPVYSIWLTFIPGPSYTFSSYAFEFSSHPYHLGLVSHVSLGEVPDFVLNTNRGKVIVSLHEIKNKMFFTKQDLKLLLELQRIFAEEAYTIVIPDLFTLEKSSKLLVAPLTKDNKIDWDLVRQMLTFDKTELVKTLTLKQQGNFHFNKESYNDAMIVPWYMGLTADKLQMHFVEEVCDQDPHSLDSFKKSLERSLGRVIMQPDLPLLRCYDIALTRNFLISYSNNLTQPSEKAKKKFNRFFHPELVHIVPIPASIILQGKYIPSILHRVNRLLAALELKNNIGKELSWNVKEVKHENALMGCKSDKENQASVTADLNSRARRSRALPSKETPGLNNKQDTKEFLKSKNFVVPEVLKDEDVTKDCIDINEVTFESFDLPPNFANERGPSSHVIMEAFTLLGANDCINLEKLEVMGDSALKLIVSTHLYSQFPNYDEGKMSSIRSDFVSNQHLYLLGKRRKFGNVLGAGRFKPEVAFLPPGFEISKELQDLTLKYNTGYEALLSLSKEKLSSLTSLENIVREHTERTQQFLNVTYTHSKVNDKSVADSVEALIGGYYLNGGLESAFRVMWWLGMEGPLSDGTSVPYGRGISFQSIPRTSQLPMNVDGMEPYNFLPGLCHLEKVLQYNFVNKWLAVEALSHGSYAKNCVTNSYERLEFVGDAVLDFLITDYILKRTGIQNPGLVTDLRSALVNNMTFGGLTVRYNFHKYLLHSSEPLHNVIKRFCQCQQQSRLSPQGMFNVISKQGVTIVEDVEIPKVLGDLFESLIGAIYVDSGFSLDEVWKRVYRLMKYEIDTFSKDIPIAPVRKMFEVYPEKVDFKEIYCANSKQSDPKMVEARIKGTTIRVRGTGSSFKAAKQAAAKYILKEFAASK